MNEKKLNRLQIESLKKYGFDVHEIYDGDPPRYAWKNRSGASQGDVEERQPYRKSIDQAWADCYAYHNLNVPSIPEKDWFD